MGYALAKKFLDFIYNSFDYGESAKIEAISNFYKLFSELLPYIKNEKNAQKADDF